MTDDKTRAEFEAEQPMCVGCGKLSVVKAIQASEVEA